MLYTDPILSRIAYRFAEWAAWHGLIPGAIVTDTCTAGSFIPSRWFFTRAIRYGIIDGSMYREVGQRWHPEDE